jgi:nucleoid DNA-binding protein
VNTKEIVVHLANTLDKDEGEMREIVERVTATLAAELAAHDRFRLPGLGTFGTKWRAAQRWYDPMLRRFRRLPERFSVFFHASLALKTRLNRRD